MWCCLCDEFAGGAWLGDLTGFGEGSEAGEVRWVRVSQERVGAGRQERGVVLPGPTRQRNWPNEERGSLGPPVLILILGYLVMFVFVPLREAWKYVNTIYILVELNTTSFCYLHLWNIFIIFLAELWIIWLLKIIFVWYNFQIVYENELCLF